MAVQFEFTSDGWRQLVQSYQDLVDQFNDAKKRIEELSANAKHAFEKSVLNSKLLSELDKFSGDNFK